MPCPHTLLQSLGCHNREQASFEINNASLLFLLHLCWIESCGSGQDNRSLKSSSQWKILAFIIISIHNIGRVAELERNGWFFICLICALCSMTWGCLTIKILTAGLCFSLKLICLSHLPGLSPPFLSASDRRCGEWREKIRPLPGAAGSCTEVGGLSAAHAPSTSVATNAEGGSVRHMFLILSRLLGFDRNILICVFTER